MLVSDIMTLDPACCTPESTTQDAARCMRARGIGMLPIVEDMGSMRIAGVVTDRDLCVGVVGAGRVPAHVLVRECMSEPAVACQAGEPAGRALETMRDHHLHRLPVVDSAGGLIGVISLTDIIRYAALPECDVVAAVARLNEPRGVSAPAPEVCKPL